MSLESINSLNQGYNNLIIDMAVSKKGMDEFIKLLNPCEYLKGYNNGGNATSSTHPIEYNYDIYYLALGEGIVLELTFCESKTDGFKEPIKEIHLSIRAYVTLDKLFIKVNKNSGCPILEILNQKGNSIFDANTTKEYLDFNNLMLNDVLKYLSVEDLVNRFTKENQLEQRKVINK